MKLIYQSLIRLYDKEIFVYFPKVEALLMASTSKVTFNSDDLIKHSTRNTLLQQSLANLPNLKTFE